MRFDDDLYIMAPLTDDKIVLTLRTAQIANTSGGTNFVVALQKAYDYYVNNKLGTIPQTTIAPSLLFDDIGVKRATVEQQKLPYYPPPTNTPPTNPK